MEKHIFFLPTNFNVYQIDFTTWIYEISLNPFSESSDFNGDPIVYLLWSWINSHFFTDQPLPSRSPSSSLCRKRSSLHPEESSFRSLVVRGVQTWTTGASWCCLHPDSQPETETLPNSTTHTPTQICIQILPACLSRLNTPGLTALTQAFQVVFAPLLFCNTSRVNLIKEQTMWETPYCFCTRSMGQSEQTDTSVLFCLLL